MRFPMTTSLDNIELELNQIDQGDPVLSAIYREKAQEILATPTIALQVRKAIAERLSQINQLLTLKTSGAEDSY